MLPAVSNCRASSETGHPKAANTIEEDLPLSLTSKTGVLAWISRCTLASKWRPAAPPMSPAYPRPVPAWPSALGPQSKPGDAIARRFPNPWRRRLPACRGNSPADRYSRSFVVVEPAMESTPKFSLQDRCACRVNGLYWSQFDGKRKYVIGLKEVRTMRGSRGFRGLIFRGRRPLFRGPWFPWRPRGCGCLLLVLGGMFLLSVLLSIVLR